MQFSSLCAENAVLTIKIHPIVLHFICNLNDGAVDDLIQVKF